MSSTSLLVSVVAVLFIAVGNVHVVAASNNTTAATPGNFTTTPKPTSTPVNVTGRPTYPITHATTVQPTSKESTFETKLEVSLKLEGECNEVKKSNLSNLIKNLYGDGNYKLKTVHITQSNVDDMCMANITVVFGKGLTSNDIVQKFENVSKMADKYPLMDGAKVVNIQVKVDGAETGEYMPKASDCKTKCCGTGGPIDVTRTCTPDEKCGNYILTKVVKDCSNVCNKYCSAGMSLQVPLLIMVLGVLVNWSLME